MIKAHNFAFLSLLALAGCSPEGQPAKAGVEVVDAWVRLPPVAGRPGAAYFTLRNDGPAAVLTAVQSAQVERVELHDSQTHDGMAHMMPLAEAAVPEGGSVAFQPGGKHAMLFGVDPKVQPGGSLALTLSLRDGRKVEAQAKAVAGGAPSPYTP